MTAALYRLASVEIPQGAGLKRGLPAKTRVSDPAFWHRYDSTTLFYDAVHLPQERRVRIFAPKFVDLKPALRQTRFRIDGVAVPASIRHFQRFDVIDIAAGAPFVQLAATGALSLTLTVSPTDIERFRGRNTLYTLSRNNDLAWIRDWVTHHVRKQGADAVLIADNGSDAYDVADIAEVLNGISGLKAAGVLAVPLPFGPGSGASRGLGRAKFLQTAMLNLVRARFLQACRAVLPCDIDELVTGGGGQSIFDAAARSWLGILTFGGDWRYALPVTSPVRHADHRWLRPGDIPCKPKYCIVPQGRLGRVAWSVHSLERLHPGLFAGGKRFRFLHCKSITTSWKVNRSVVDPAGLIEDSAFARETDWSAG